MRLEIVNFYQPTGTKNWIAHLRFEKKYESLDFDDFDIQVSPKEDELISLLMARYECGCYIEMHEIVKRLKFAQAMKEEQNE